MSQLWDNLGEWKGERAREKRDRDRDKGRGSNSLVDLHGGFVLPSSWMRLTSRRMLTTVTLDNGMISQCFVTFRESFCASHSIAQLTKTRLRT